MSINKYDTLLVCVTPFQAHLAARMTHVGYISDFDFLYLNFGKHCESIAVNHLRKIAKNAEILTGGNYRFSFLRSLDLIFRIKRLIAEKDYRRIFVASVDALPIRAITANYPDAEIHTFDDGAANILCSTGYDMHYSTRDSIYTKLLAAESPNVLVSRSQTHTTIYPGLTNIVDDSRLRTISIIDVQSLPAIHSNKLTIFIGQPFSEFLTEGQTELLCAYVNSINIDYYLMHPRELNPISSRVPVLERRGMVAEELISELAMHSRVTVVGSFSSVLLNLPPAQFDKRYLSVGDDALEIRRRELCERSGCEIVLLV